MLSVISRVLSPITHAAKSAWGTGVHAVESGVHDVESAVGLAPHHVAPDQGELTSAAQHALSEKAKGNDPGARSQLAWNSLTQHMGKPGAGIRSDADLSGSSTAWSYGQTMVAALDQAKQSGNYTDFDHLYSGLQQFKKADGSYAPSTNGHSGQGDSYYDDNSWIGLANMQAYKQTGDKKYLTSAEQTFNFLQSGVKNGGLQWCQNQNPPTWNTCTEGPAAELGMQLHMATAKNPKDTNDKYFQFAQTLNDNMNKYLREPDGLYRDHVNADDPSQKSNGVYSYNQGTPVGLNTLFYQATGNDKYLEDAQQTANNSLSDLQKGKGFFSKSPAFNAIYFRNLMQLNAVAPNKKYTQALATYNNQLWNQGRDPQTDLFDQNGVGHYGQNPSGTDMNLLDQAGVVQLFSLQAMSPGDYRVLT